MTFIFVVGVIGVGFGQSLELGENNQSSLSPALGSHLIPNLAAKGINLFDPSKFEMNHTLSVGYTTDGKNSLMSNMYLNTIHYQFSPKLDVRLHLGLAHQPAAMSSVLESDQKFVLPGAEMTYRPTENMTIYFNFSTIRGNYSSDGDMLWYPTPSFSRFGSGY